MPECRQVLRERLQGARIDLLHGDRARVEARQPRLLLTDAFERGIPARLECRRDQTLLGIDVFVAAGGELRVIACLFELKLQRLSLLTLPLARPLRRGDRRVNGLWRNGLQNLLAHRVVNDLAGAGHTGRCAGLVMATHTPEVRRGTVTAAVTDLEGVAAASAPQESRQETPTAARRLARARLHVGVRFDHRQMAAIARPIKVPRMVVRNHDLPLIDGQIMPSRPSDSAIDNQRAALALAVHVGAREERIRDDGVHPRVIRERPFGGASVLAATRDGHRDALATEPEQDLPRAPELVKFLEHEANRLLHPDIGIELDRSRRSVDQPDGQMHPQLPALGLRALSLKRALPERRHLEIAHDALEPEQQAIVDETGVIDPIVIDEHDLRDRPEFHQLRPIPIVARQPRGFERQDGAGRTRADGRQQPLKSGPLGESGARDAQIIVDGLHTPEAHVPRDVGERILPPLTLQMSADLAGRRLAHVHECRPLEMISGDLGAHRPAPHRRRSLPRWRAANRPAPSPGPVRSAPAGSRPVPRARMGWAVVSVVDDASGSSSEGWVMRSCAERAAATKDRSSVRASTETRTGPFDSAAHATRSVIHTGMAAVR